MTFEIVVRDEAGEAMADCDVRVTCLRKELLAPDGSSLGNDVQVTLDSTKTDADGRVTGFVTTRTSLHAYRDRKITEDFDLKVEAQEDDDTWTRLADIVGLRADTIVCTEPGVGRVIIAPASAAAGEKRMVTITPLTVSNAPAGYKKPVVGAVVDFRAPGDPPLNLGLTPAPGHTWRTNHLGFIKLEFVPALPGLSRSIQAVVDGKVLMVLEAIVTT